MWQRFGTLGNDGWTVTGSLHYGRLTFKQNDPSKDSRSNNLQGECSHQCCQLFLHRQDWKQMSVWCKYTLPHVEWLPHEGLIYTWFHTKADAAIRATVRISHMFALHVVLHYSSPLTLRFKPVLCLRRASKSFIPYFISKKMKHLFLFKIWLFVHSCVSLNAIL